MLDIKFIKENPDQVKKGISIKGYQTELVDQAIELYDSWSEKLRIWEDLRHQRNEIAKQHKPSDEGRALNEKIVKAELEVQGASQKYFEVINKIPNLPADDVPEG